jgi:hypothetical protein
MDRRLDEVFGTEPQQALLRRARAFHDLTRHDTRYTYYGRTVGLASPQDGDIDEIHALTALQGNSHYAKVPDDALPGLRDAAIGRGLSVARYARWTGGAEARDAARAVLDRHRLPKGLAPVILAPESPPETVLKLAQVALACGVLPPSGAVLRGLIRPAVAIVALDERGQPAACAAAAGFLHPDHPDAATTCWWGMLATRPERRGQRLALILGAMAMLEMQARHGFTQVFTGVEPGNAPSEAICTRLGLARDGTSVLAVADPRQVPGGRMTR